MGDVWQKNQLQLAFMDEPTGEALPLGQPRAESPVARHGTERPLCTEPLMEEIVQKENAKQALRRVQDNHGSPGIDGMTVAALGAYFQVHWGAIKQALLEGLYRPKPVRRVEIPKPDGGVRKLGIPTVVDRFVQQLVLQVLQREWDPTFAEHSYGFRPGRSAQQAVAQAQTYIAEGYSTVVDIDLEKFFEPGPPRSIDEPDRHAGDRQAGPQADPGVPQRWRHGTWAGESHGGRNPARGAALAVVEQYRAG